MNIPQSSPGSSPIKIDRLLSDGSIPTAEVADYHLVIWDQQTNDFIGHEYLIACSQAEYLERYNGLSQVYALTIFCHEPNGFEEHASSLQQAPQGLSSSALIWRSAPPDSSSLSNDRHRGESAQSWVTHDPGAVMALFMLRKRQLSGRAIPRRKPARGFQPRTV